MFRLPTIAKLSHDEYVSLEILERICRALHCEIGDVVELGGEPKNHEAAETYSLRVSLRTVFLHYVFLPLC